MRWTTSVAGVLDSVGSVTGTLFTGDVRFVPFWPQAAASPVHCAGDAGLRSWYTVDTFSPVMSVSSVRTVTTRALRPRRPSATSRRRRAGRVTRSA